MASAAYPPWSVCYLTDKLQNHTHISSITDNGLSFGVGD
jgi:hypothetical protein